MIFDKIKQFICRKENDMEELGKTVVIKERPSMPYIVVRLVGANTNYINPRDIDIRIFTDKIVGYAWSSIDANKTVIYTVDGQVFSSSETLEELDKKIKASLA